jgi:hypothetical protein
MRKWMIFAAAILIFQQLTAADAALILSRDKTAVVKCSAAAERVIIPDGVKYIGKSAFMQCSSLKSVKLGKRLKSVGDWAFYGCKNLTEITLPASLENVGGGVFGEVPALRAAEDNPVLKTDSAGALLDVKRKIFLYLPSGHKGSYTIPAGMTMIGYYAFAGCRDLTRVNVPDGMGFIDDWVFHGCNRLTLISVPAEMKYFGDYVIPLGCKVHRP